MDAKLIITEFEQTKLLFESIESKKQMSAIERDLILEKLRKIYDHILNLEFKVEAEETNESVSTTESGSKPNASDSSTSKLISTSNSNPAKSNTDIIPNINEVQINSDVQAVEMPKPDIDDITPEQNISESRPVIEEAKDIILDIETEKSNIENEIAEQVNNVEAEPKTKILAETFESGALSVNEMITQHKETPGVLEQPIADIESSIGLNEKFLFIRELFAGNAQLYAQTIDKLNFAGSYEIALNIVKANFNWNYNAEITIRLLDLVRRRYL
jgi:hypothetical protein